MSKQNKAKKAQKNNRSFNEILNNLKLKELENSLEELSDKCSFNFKYLIKENGLKYTEHLNEKILEQLFSRLIYFSDRSLKSLQNEKDGTWKRNIFESYGTDDVFKFEEKSDYERPTNIPKGVEWGRFRLMGLFRLAGFILPDKYCQDPMHPDLNRNTFYVVFIDTEHKFYKSSKK